MGALLARLRALSGNRWAMAGLAGAAGLGAVALARSRGHGASPPSPETDGATAEAGQVAGAAFTGQAFPNTYATDLAAAVGDLDGRYAEQVADFSESLAANQTALDALSTADAKQAASIAAVTSSVAALKPAPPAKAKPQRGKGKTVAAPAKTAAGWRMITVRSGDTLGAIARRYDTSVGALSRQNKITDPNRIRAGAKLRVPV